MTVGPEGVPYEISLEESAGRADLDAAAIAAIRKWRFRPGTWNRERVELDVLVPVRFALRDPPRTP